MPIILDGTAGIDNDATDLSYTGTLTGGTGVVNLGSGQVYKDASGNVGIGTSSPTEKLQVASSTTNSTLKISNSTTGSASGDGLDLIADGTDGYVWNRENGPLLFGTNNAERMRINSSGSLLVGTTSGAARVVIQKAAGAADGMSIGADSGGAGISFGHSTSTGTPCYFATTSGQAGFISVSGNTTSYNSGSDYRLKDNVRPLTGALEAVAKLKPVAFEWKHDGSYGDSFLAHELAEVCPQAVMGEKDAVNEDGSIKPQGIDTSFLVATLTAAIQEQQAIIESLTARVVALEGQA